MDAGLRTLTKIIVRISCRTRVVPADWTITAILRTICSRIRTIDHDMIVRASEAKGSRSIYRKVVV